MTFTVTVNGFCNQGQGEHVHLTIHVGERDIPVTVTREELLADLPEKEDMVQQRLKSFCLENWTGSWAALKTAIEATEFKV